MNFKEIFVSLRLGLGKKNFKYPLRVFHGIKGHVAYFARLRFVTLNKYTSTNLQEKIKHNLC